MINLDNSSKIHNFEGKISNDTDIVGELMKATLSGKEIFVVGEVTERTSGFHRGSLLSSLVSNLKKLKESSNIKICLKNTFEDLDFYSRVLEKVPGVYFHFDEESAKKYSRNSLDEWKNIVAKYSID